VLKTVKKKFYFFFIEQIVIVIKYMQNKFGKMAAL
jgi:hypothetical protein